MDSRKVEELRAAGEGRTAVEGAVLADRIVSALLTWTLLGTGLLAVLVIVLAGPLAQLLLAAETPGAAGVPLGASLLRIFALQLPLYGVSVVLAAYLQARKRFLWPAMMPLLSSVTVMIAYRVYAHLVPRWPPRRPSSSPPCGGSAGAPPAASR
ncbi:lipid II flippase MurJ [Brachybacterium sp. Z12]|uniref:lipid II flippase MurJ n=1 Tax=Brachybacterium sp. Z12 TaxID=2759167 RepID=UPI00223B3C3B|nr:lipid II flippase MurJ [Brachybacterium sp. Z12]